MFFPSHHIIATASAASVALRVATDSVSHGLAAALENPATIALALAGVVAFVVVRERGIKNEQEIKVLRDEHKDVMGRLELGMKEMRGEIRAAMERHEMNVRNVLTAPLLKIGELEGDTRLLNQRLDTLEHLTGGSDR